MTHPLVQTARELSVAVGGVDWSQDAVNDCKKRLAAQLDVSRAVLDEALLVLVNRLHKAAIDDADGVAQVAIAAGALVECGASAEPLARVLVSLLPSVLIAARRFADRCLAALASPQDGDEPRDDTFIEVDDRAISRVLFRGLLRLDQPGGRALGYLSQWVSPAIAALSRSRTELTRAQSNTPLREAASAMARSAAHGLLTLLDAELSQRWIVLVPSIHRGFEVEVDGVVSNVDLYTLLAAALVPRGVPGVAPSAELIAYLEGHGPMPADPSVTGAWNLYDHRAASLDLSAPMKIPRDYWLWGEGRPIDVIRNSGQRVIVIAAAAYERSANVVRTFSALPQSIRVVRELPADALTAW